MRVLWPHNFPEQNPVAGRFMHLLARGIRALGVDVELYSLGNLRDPAQVLRAERGLRVIARGYDLVHAQFGSACSLLVSTIPGKKVMSLRGSDWHRYRGPDKRERRAGRLATVLSHLSAPRFDAIVTMSRRMEAEVRETVKHPNVVTIPDPVDVHQFRPRDRVECRRQLGEADTGAWVLFTTANYSNPVKRLELAKQAVAAARMRRHDVMLKIATGISPDRMPIFVAACDIALCTSVHEGWPNSIKEALSCGLPFVSTDVSDLRDVAVRHPSCHVCPPDAEALGNSICDALDAARDETLPTVVEDMDIPAVSRRLVTLYESLLDRAPHGSTNPMKSAR